MDKLENEVSIMSQSEEAKSSSVKDTFSKKDILIKKSQEEPIGYDFL